MWVWNNGYIYWWLWLLDNSSRFKKSRWSWLNRFDQEALKTWRGRLQHFLQLLYNQKIQKVILIWFVHLLKSNKFPEFHRCGSKNVPATPIFIFNFKVEMSTTSHFLSYTKELWTPGEEGSSIFCNFYIIKKFKKWY